MTGGSLPEVPWSELRLLSLDSGNTLFSMDFAWVAQELSRWGLEAGTEELERAELAARPRVSARRMKGLPRGFASGFELYLRLILDHLDTSSGLTGERLDEIASVLSQVLDGPGQKRHLWSQLIPGVREALPSLKATGMILIVVSNSDGTLRGKLEEYGLAQYFDRIVDSGEIGIRKPDPRIFEVALAGLGVAPERSLHVGDFYFADIVGAWRAGMHALLLDPGRTWGHCGCPRLSSVAEVARALLEARRP